MNKSTREQALDTAVLAIDRANDILQGVIDRDEKMRREIARCLKNLGRLIEFALDENLSKGEAAAVDSMLDAAAACREVRKFPA